MKIGQPTDIPVVTTTPSPAASAAKSGQGAAASASRSASSASVAVTVSSHAQSLGQAKRSEAAAIDSEKVNAVRASIEQGTYVVNPEAIADKLLANAKEMLSRTRN